MTQWKMKILNRKNGKGTVTEANDDDEVKATKNFEVHPGDEQKECQGGQRREIHA